MKKAIIFHGTDCKPTDFWYPWLGKQLEDRGVSVEIPSYPDINHEDIETFLPKVLQNHTFDDETVLIGHSAGGPLIISLLERMDTVISQAFLVAGFSKELPNDHNPILQSSYNWEKIRAHVKDIYFLNSTKDPWGCNDEQGRIMLDHLGGTQIIREDGHFGSNAHNQPYKEFPLLERLVV